MNELLTGSPNSAATAAGYSAVSQRSDPKIVFSFHESAPFVVIRAVDHRHAVELTIGERLGWCLS